jgi:hypothetical protein
VPPGVAAGVPLPSQPGGCCAGPACGAGGCGEPGEAESRTWGGADYLLWWTKRAVVPNPFLTTTTNPFAAVNGNNVAGGIGQDGTIPLVGARDLGLGAFSGGRVTAGLWLDDAGIIGLEARGWLLEHRTSGAGFASDPTGNPVIGIPIIDNQGLFGGGEVAITDSFPGTFAGSLRTFTSLRLWGADGNMLLNLARSEWFSLDLMTGGRYANLSEQLGLVTNTSNLIALPNGAVAFNGALFNGTVTTADSFKTQNRFYGGQIGARTEVHFGDAFLRLTGKVALGATDQIIDIQGVSALLTGGQTTVAPGGTLAQASNSGRTSHTAFSVIPELELTVGYDITPCCRVFVGYNFLYWSDVVRPGDQVNRRIDVTQVPTLVTFNPAVAAGQPARLSRSTDFWAQGITCGLALQF